MAQGTSKGLKAKTPSGGRKKAGLTKKGKRDVAPKNAQRVKEKQQQKVGHLHLPFFSSQKHNVSELGGWHTSV